MLCEFHVIPNVWKHSLRPWIHKDNAKPHHFETFISKSEITFQEKQIQPPYSQQTVEHARKYN